MKKYAYSMDAGALITAHERYPVDVFPAFWDKAAQLIRCEKVFLCDLTFAEIVKHEGEGDALYQWAQKIRDAHSTFVKVTSDEEMKAAAEISRRFPKLKTKSKGKRKESSPADSFIIAHAQITNTTVVTEEKPSGGEAAQKIPDVCKVLNVECIDLLKMMRREKWVF